VAGSVAGGYVTAAVGFAYIATFYLVTRTWFGWWVPSELLDDPTQIATGLPWVAGIAASMQAAIWEGALFRAVPRSMFALWSRHREDRERWMALGVIVTAILFGFAHSNYPSWPPYSRGIEIFLEACVWAVLFLRFGLLVPVLAHFFYDVVLFGLFATGGDALAYRITAGVILLVLAAPGLVVLAARLRQGGWRPLPDEARFGAWLPPEAPAVAPAPVPSVQSVATPRSRQVAVGCLLLAIIGTLLDRPGETAGPRFVAGRHVVLATADSMLRDRGEDPVTWRRLTRTTVDTGGLARALFRREDAESLSVQLADSWAIPAWWTIRYVSPSDSLAERASEWRVRVLPDGRPLDVRHLVPDERAGASLEPESARAIARQALQARGVDLAPLLETEYDADELENRRDVTVTWVDTSVVLPGGATARVAVSLAGDEVVGVTRGVEVPESFERALRNEGMNAIILAGLLGMALLGTIVWAIARTIRRLPVRFPPFPKSLGRRLLLLILVVAAADGLQGLPTALADYPTAEPWDRFIGSVVVTQFLGLIALLLLAALWMLVSGLRRRIGIPLVSAEWRLTPLPDDLVLGLGLGALLPLLGVVAGVLPVEGMASVPSTSLDSAVPALARVPRVFVDMVSMVPLLAIPILAIIGAVSTPNARLTLAALVLGLGGAVMVAMEASVGSPQPIAIAWAVVAVGIFLLAIRNWAGVSLVTWLVAAATQAGIEELNRVAHAPTGVEQFGALLGVVTAVGLVAALMAWVRRHGRSEPTPAA
jgi:hypothetical protein